MLAVARIMSVMAWMVRRKFVTTDLLSQVSDA
jgi:hypothetical protein